MTLRRTRPAGQLSNTLVAKGEGRASLSQLSPSSHSSSPVPKVDSEHSKHAEQQSGGEVQRPRSQPGAMSEGADKVGSRRGIDDCEEAATEREAGSKAVPPATASRQVEPTALFPSPLRMCTCLRHACIFHLLYLIRVCVPPWLTRGYFQQAGLGQLQSCPATIHFRSRTSACSRSRG